MVCLGNICRSPLAEGILQNKVTTTQIFVDSAATAGYHVGNRPDSRSIDVAHKYGISIESQRCRKFTIQDFNDFDLIYAMDRSNYHNIIAMDNNKDDIKKVKLILDEVELGIKEVPDPYLDDDGFEDVYHLIDAACEAIAYKLERK